MSGGHFDYQQYRINDIADSIDELIEKNNDIDEWGWGYNYSDETLEEFKKASEILKEAAIYAQRIDWLVSGDDGEENFHKRLKEDLEEYEQASQNK